MNSKRRQIISPILYSQNRKTLAKYIAGSVFVIILLAYYVPTQQKVTKESDQSAIKETSAGKDIKNPGIKEFYENIDAPVINGDERVDEDRKRFLEQRDKEFIAFTEKYEQNSSYSEKRYRLPGLIGIGVEKCGTGALQCMLENHPMLKSGKIREAHYFNRYYRGGLRMYYRFLPKVLDYQIPIEKTPGYFQRNWKVPYRMKKDVPDSKLYVMLCDPVNRTFSDFVQEIWTHKLPQNTSYDSKVPEIIDLIQKMIENSRIEGNDTAISQEILELEKKQYISHIISEGLYYYHLLRWFKVYDQSEILILNGGDILTRPWIHVEQIQRHLKIPMFITKENFVLNPETGFYSARPLVVTETDEGKKVTYGQPACYELKNKGRTRNGHWDHTPKKEVVDLVRKFYRNSNEKLYKLIGQRFNWQ